MYQFIIHPKTGEKLSIHSHKGKQLFKKQFKMSQTNYQKAGATNNTEELEVVETKVEPTTSLLPAPIILRNYNYYKYVPLEQRTMEYWRESQSRGLTIWHPTDERPDNNAEWEIVDFDLVNVIIEGLMPNLANPPSVQPEILLRDQSVEVKEIGPLEIEYIIDPPPGNEIIIQGIEENYISLGDRLDALQSYMSMYRNVIREREGSNNPQDIALVEDTRNSLEILENELFRLVGYTRPTIDYETKEEKKESTTIETKEEVSFLPQLKTKSKRIKKKLKLKNRDIEIDIEKIKYLTVIQIKEKLKKLGLKRTGNKSDLVNRLWEANKRLQQVKIEEQRIERELSEDKMLAELNNLEEIQSKKKEFESDLLAIKKNELKFLLEATSVDENVSDLQKIIIASPYFDINTGYFKNGLSDVLDNDNILTIITNLRDAVKNSDLWTGDLKHFLKRYKKRVNKIVRMIAYLNFKKNWISNKVIKNRNMLAGELLEGYINNNWYGLNMTVNDLPKNVVPDALKFLNLEGLYDLVNQLEEKDFLYLDLNLMKKLRDTEQINTIVKNNKLLNREVNKWLENPEEIVDLGSIYLQQIMDDVMTNRCPKCNEVLADKGEGCMSMRCANAQCPLYNPVEDDTVGANNRICGYCLQNFSDGDEAHDHVANCSYNPNPGSYFLSHPSEEEIIEFGAKYPDYIDSNKGEIDINTINQLRIIKIHNRRRKDKLIDFLNNMNTNIHISDDDKHEIQSKLLSHNHNFSLAKNPFKIFLEGVGFHEISFNVNTNRIDSSQIGIAPIINEFLPGDSEEKISHSSVVKIGGSDSKSSNTLECMICMDDITPEQRFPCICNTPICWACTIEGQKTLWEGSNGFPRKDFQGVDISSKLKLHDDKTSILCACASQFCPSINKDKNSIVYKETHNKNAYQIVKGLKSCEAKDVWKNFIKLRCREYMKPIIKDLDMKLEEEKKDLLTLFKKEYMRIKRENIWVKQLSGIFNIPMYFYPLFIKIIEETAYYGGNKLPRDYYLDPENYDPNVIINFWMANDWGEDEKKEFWTEFCKDNGLNSNYIIDNIMKGKLT